MEKCAKKTILSIVGLAFFIIIGVGSDDSGTSTSSSSSSRSKTSGNETLEYQLAVINKGGYVVQSDITVTRFRYLLETLERKTINSRQEIADMSVAAITGLRERYGRDVSLLQFMEGLDSSISAGAKVDYAIASAAYMQLLK